MNEYKASIIEFQINVFRKLILIALICITSRHICAQEQNNNWVFGYSARVNFGGPVPNGSFFSSINSNEQCASVSDPITGNLLFFTDGVSVWRGNNSLMPNGNNLMGGAYLSASQGALIVPFPENNQKYFIFTLDEMEYDVPPVYNGLRYTVVDMSLDGGAGDVDVNNKNVLLFSDSLTEKMTVVRSETIRGYWVIVHRCHSNEFLAYKVNGCGVDTVPVISAVGTPLISNDPSSPNLQFLGSIKANNAGNRLGMPMENSKFVEFYDFNSTTGIVTNPLKIEINDNTPNPPFRKYGASFSPDGSKFYFTNLISVYQLDLTSYDSLSIANSATIVNTPIFPPFQIEEAPDGKLYVGLGNVGRLDVIAQPNNAGAACAYGSNAVLLNGTCQLSLPPKVPERNFLPPPFDIDFNCANLQLTAQINQVSSTGIAWNMGVPNSNLTGNPITFTYPDTGTVTITASINEACYAFVADTVFNVYQCACSPSSSSLNAIACFNYTAPSGIIYSSTGTYTDTIPNYLGCDSLITINLSITGNPIISVASVSGTCGLPNGTATATATGGSGNYAYTWSNGATGNFVSGLVSGSYTVVATDQNGCSSTSQVLVSTSPAAGVTLIAGDTILGINESVTFTINGGDTYNWSPANGLSCFDCPSVIAAPTSSTTYTVTGIDSSGCPYLRVVNVVVDIVCSELFVPDIFSPNGQGNAENEKLCVYSNCIKSMNLGIYNRWGELIFSTDNQNACWDGTHKGEPVMTGVYSYRLFVEQFDGEKIERTGNITLKR
jgi:gliding motility-associated-like protein